MICEQDITRTDKGETAMSGLIHWEPFRAQLNPWRELEDIQKRLSAMWGGAPVKAGGQKESIAVAEWSPRWTLPKTRRSM